MGEPAKRTPHRELRRQRQNIQVLDRDEHENYFIGSHPLKVQLVLKSAGRSLPQLREHGAFLAVEIGGRHVEPLPVSNSPIAFE